MNETFLTPRAVWTAVVVAAATAALLIPEAMTAEAASEAKREHVKHKRHAKKTKKKKAHSKKHRATARGRHKRKKAKRKAAPSRATASPAPAPAPATRTTTTCSRSPGYAAGTTTPFEQHFSAAHLGRSPAGQVEDAGDVSAYAQLHTALVDAMSQPTLSASDSATIALQRSLEAFLAHLGAAHLEQSPTQQVTAILDPDTYTLTHTVLVANVLKPVLDWVNEVMSGKETCTTTEEPAESPPPSPGAPSPASVDISGHMYMPHDLSVPTGSQVTWTNNDTEPHNVYADGGAFKSSTLEKGQTYSYTFSSPGTYSYVCSIHPDMKGTVTAG